MPEICQTCGLPTELCMCEEIAKEKQRIRVSTETKKYGKKMTVIEGIDDKDIDIGDLAKKLKRKCACGGTSKNMRIELQGDHRDTVMGELISLGFSENMIEVK